MNVGSEEKEGKKGTKKERKGIGSEVISVINADSNFFPLPFWVGLVFLAGTDEHCQKNL